MEHTITDRVLVTPPQKAHNILTRYKWLSLSLAEPNLGVTPPLSSLPATSDAWTLSSDELGNRGWAAGEKPYIYGRFKGDFSIKPALGENIIYSEIDDFFPARSTISGGEKNAISFSNSFIGAGYSNEIIANSVLGSNTGKGFNFIGSGNYNKISITQNSSILNGAYNTISSGNPYNQILNGLNNKINVGDYNTIYSGTQNITMGRFTLVGGQSNLVSSFYSNIINGIGNRILTGSSSILNGENNYIDTTQSVELQDTFQLTELGTLEDSDVFLRNIKVTTGKMNGEMFVFVSNAKNNTVLIYGVNNDALYLKDTIDTAGLGLTNTSEFGFDLDIEPSTGKLYISSPGFNGSGAVFLYDFNSIIQSFVYINKITAAEQVDNNGERFGHSIKASPFTLTVGSPDFNNATGRVFVFTKTSSLNNSFNNYIVLNGESFNDKFGTAVGNNLLNINSLSFNISGALAISAPGYTYDSKVNVGTVYVFTVGYPINGSNVTYFNKLTAASNKLTANSQLGNCRFLSFNNNANPSNNDYGIDMILPAPFYTTVNQTSGAFIPVSFNLQFADSIFTGAITQFQNISASNIGFSSANKFAGHENVYGAPDISLTNNKQGAVFVRDSVGGFNHIILTPSDPIIYNNFGSSVDYNSPYIVTVGYNIITGYADAFVYNYMPAAKMAVNATILAGKSNTIYGRNSLIPYGEYNTIHTGTRQTLVAGLCNTVHADVYNAGILGNNNTVLSGLNDVNIFGSNLIVDRSNTTFVEDLSVTGTVFGDGSGLNPAGVLFYNRETNSAGLFTDFFPISAGSHNISFGVGAGFSNLGGHNNLFTGLCAGYYNSTGTDNQFFGLNAGYNNSIGSYNIFLGKYAGLSNIEGGSNIFLGLSAGIYNTTGDNNIFLGREAGVGNIAGSNNIIIGLSSTNNNDDNIIIGNNTVVGNNSNVVVIGNDATATASNQFVLGSITSPLSVITSNVRPLTSNGDVLLIRINGINRAIKLFDYYD